jgi:lipopolysaccharide export system protein LptA
MSKHISSQIHSSDFYQDFTGPAGSIRSLKRLPLLLLLSSLLLSPTLAQAEFNFFKTKKEHQKDSIEAKDESQPIEIQSDSANFEEKTGQTTHKGHVKVTQGSRMLWADTLVIDRSKEGKINHIVAYGKPAHFEAYPNPEKPKLMGSAKIIHYYLSDHKIVLLENAELTQNENTIKSNRLTYFLESKTLVSDPKTVSNTTVILNSKRQP